MLLHVLILAAGEGKRMRSARPKLLHPCAGAPLIAHAVRAACTLDADSVHVVVGPDDDALRAALDCYPVAFAVQEKPSGTADAVAAGCAALAGSSGTLLVINGDCPGVLSSTLQTLVAASDGVDATVLSVRPEEPSDYGRLLRGDAGRLVGIVEASDATAEQDTSPEVNGGVYCFDLEALRGALDAVGTDNVQAERYLTRVFALLADAGATVRAVPHADADEVHGVNSRAELARAEALLRRRTIDRLMDSEVTVLDPATTYVDVDVDVGVDSTLHPGVILEGSTVIGTGCEVRSRVRVTDSRIGDRVSILDGTIIEESTVDDEATLGPYARLRPGSEIGSGAKVGNFVETKATKLGAGSKAGHLAYLGNARIGENVNIGAGTITCNYDGAEKHETVIDDGAFIGSNTTLVAPVRVGKNAFVGAGSTITEDVPAGSLALGRGRQVNKINWADKRD
jgi:bifunctional UDP-N-acetylglucosamine pyrophosphorylase/glucosamine-1-phosphate N-acetyltransferase